MREQVALQTRDKMRRVILMLFIVFAVSLGASCVHTHAASINAPVVEQVYYSGSGDVYVSFRDEVKYNNVDVSVSDVLGQEYSVSQIDNRSGSISFHINKYKTGRKYRFKVKGIKVKGFRRYTSVKGSVIISGNKKVIVDSVRYDSGEYVVTFLFRGKVKWKNPTVKIYNKKKSFKTRIISKNKKELNIRVSKLRYGNKYKYRIAGVKRNKSLKYGSVKGSFKATDR